VEDLCLLCATPSTGDIAFKATQMGCFSLAAIADLVLQDRISLETAEISRDMKVKAMISDRTPTANPWLDRPLESLVRNAHSDVLWRPPEGVEWRRYGHAFSRDNNTIPVDRRDR
jgi:hypothetical protein